ncbi:hypothetical protein [Nitrosomonas communis]|uniref:hypothetical protein n=1 Tax=Nitrosomonas communis TaxID=44574 RepID=UPI0026F04431|nr:hypothetical protein [Nitrosomonas communis]MCO6427528.1 hypothetical protein [Nitrosomonas communis]
MTTIAYKNGIIAYDSRLMVGNLIYDDDFDKKIEVDGVIFFMSGTVSDYPAFIDAYFGKPNNNVSLDVESIALHDGVLYRSSVDDKGVCWKSPLRRENSYAIGSGSHFALAFMDAGYHAEGAVKATIKRDCWTGGNVNTFVLR